MPKYILIGLIVVIGAYCVMNYWPKLQENTKNKAIASIFGIIAVAFVLVLGLLFI